VTKFIGKSCMVCKMLGNCREATVEMLKNKEGCGNWKIADVLVIDARLKACALAGSRALNAMIIKDPPKKPAKPHRR
jgi:hypothetical protein